MDPLCFRIDNSNERGVQDGWKHGTRADFVVESTSWCVKRVKGSFNGAATRVPRDENKKLLLGKQACAYRDIQWPRRRERKGAWNI